MFIFQFHQIQCQFFNFLMEKSSNCSRDDDPFQTLFSKDCAFVKCFTFSLPVKCGLHLHEWCMNKVPNWRFVWVHCLRKWLCWSPFHNPECISMYFQWYKNSTSKRVHYVHCWRPGHYQSDKQINRSQCAFNWVFTLYCSFTSLRRYHTVWYSCWWMFLAWVFLRLNCRWSYYFWCTIQTVAKVLSMLQREQINVNFSNIHVASDTMNSNRPVMVLILHTTYTDSTQYAVK